MLTATKGIHELLQYCPRLTHLSLTGVQAFLREDLTRFCRDAPPEFTHPQRDVFCVFSGEGVSRLREYLKRLAEDQERESRVTRERTGLYSEADADSSRETLSDDGTIDAVEEVLERRPTIRPTLRPRSAGYRSYAEVVSGSGSNSPGPEDEGADDDEGVPLSQVRYTRLSELFRRSGGPGSFVEHDGAPQFRGYLNRHIRREASRSVSEGQGSSREPRFTSSDPQSGRSRLAQSELPAFDDYFHATAEPQYRRALPPRPHWPPQAQTARFFDGDQEISAPGWGEFAAPEAARTAIGATGSGSASGRHGVQSREDPTTSAVYDDTDDDDHDDGETTIPQSARVHREMDGEMES